MQALKLGSVELNSRLILGTGKYDTLELMQEALEASGSEMVTVALRKRRNCSTFWQMPGSVGWSRLAIMFRTSRPISVIVAGVAAGSLVRSTFMV